MPDAEEKRALSCSQLGVLQHILKCSFVVHSTHNTRALTHTNACTPHAGIALKLSSSLRYAEATLPAEACLERIREGMIHIFIYLT